MSELLLPPLVLLLLLLAVVAGWGRAPKTHSKHAANLNTLKSIKRHPPTFTYTHPHTHKIHIDSEALVKGKRIGQGVKRIAGWRAGSRVVANKKKPL